MNNSEYALTKAYYIVYKLLFIDFYAKKFAKSLPKNRLILIIKKASFVACFKNIKMVFYCLFYPINNQ